MKTQIDWLLEEGNPGLRFLALRDLLHVPDGDAELESARWRAYAEGPIARVLDSMYPEGYWTNPGPGYGPKYRTTVWAILTLAQLGARSQDDVRIARGCAYLLDHALAPQGQFSYNGAASGNLECLQGNLCWALVTLGYDDARLPLAFDWMARAVTGEGIASVQSRDLGDKYQRYKVGPLFRCMANSDMPCAWAAVKVMMALGAVPDAERTPAQRRALAEGAAFLLDHDLVRADYPTGIGTTSPLWWRFVFPVYYASDLLQNVDALVRLGYGEDVRLLPALEVIRGKADEDGRWAMEHKYRSPVFQSFGPLGKPNKWVTLRALRVLQAVGERVA